MSKTLLLPRKSSPLEITLASMIADTCLPSSKDTGRRPLLGALVQSWRNTAPDDQSDVTWGQVMIKTEIDIYSLFLLWISFSYFVVQMPCAIYTLSGVNRIYLIYFQKDRDVFHPHSRQTMIGDLQTTFQEVVKHKMQKIFAYSALQGKTVQIFIGNCPWFHKYYTWASKCVYHIIK